MNTIAQQLHTFYSAQISENERRALHTSLLVYLSSESCLEEADAHIVTCIAELKRADRVKGAGPPDAFLLHFLLHAVETRARTGFDRTSPPVRLSLLRHLVELLVCGFAWNVRCAVESMPSANGIPHSSAASSMPAYVLTKSARAAVELGKREWVADATSLFPGMILGLIDQNGHTSDSLPKIFGGMVILTTLVDDALDTTRASIRAADRSVLSKRIASIGDGILAALEVGLRISGPGLPSSVPAAASRTIGSVARIAPEVSLAAIAILQQRTMSSICDEVGAEALGVLAELYSETRLPLQSSQQLSTLRHLTELLNRIAMRELANGEGDVLDLYRRRLTSYAEAVLVRFVSFETNSTALENCLNGLMGSTMRWASESPSAFPNALDAWINILEALEDADQELGPLLTTAFGALGRVCAEKAMFMTNGSVLSYLETDDDLDDEAHGVAPEVSVFHGTGDSSRNPEIFAEVARSPTSLAASALFGKSDTADDGIAEGGLSGEVGSVTREEYIGKCVEVLSIVSRVMPDTVALQATELCSRVLMTEGPTGLDSHEDRTTAAHIASCIAPLLSVDSDAAKSLASSVVSCVSVSPHVGRREARRNMKGWKPTLDVNLLRCASLLAPVFDPSLWPESRNLTSGLVNLCRDALGDAGVSNELSLACTLLLLSFCNAFPASLFRDEPPFAPALVNGRRGPVAGIGVVGLAQWALDLWSVKRKGRASLVKSTSADELWPPRMARLQKCCEAFFADFLTSCARNVNAVDENFLNTLCHGSQMAHSLFWSVYDESFACKDAVWGAVAREICRSTVTGLQRICSAEVGSSIASDARGDGLRSAWFKCIGVLVNCMGCALRVFRRQIAGEAPTLAQEVINTALAPAMQGQSTSLARSLLFVLREQLGDGYSAEKEHMVAPAVQLAVRSLEGDGDVGLAGVGVLTEALSRHWTMFWPGDTASFLSPQAPAPREVEPSADVRSVYLAAFGGLLSVVRSSDAGLSREGISALERIHAARKLFERESAFKKIGGGVAVVSACLGAMMSFPFLQDDAASLVWSVAQADTGAFFGENGVLVASLVGLHVCSDVQMIELVGSFGRPSDRPTFVRCVESMVNDIRYASTLNRGPSL